MHSIHVCVRAREQRNASQKIDPAPASNMWCWLSRSCSNQRTAIGTALRVAASSPFLGLQAWLFAEGWLQLLRARPSSSSKAELHGLHLGALLLELRYLAPGEVGLN